MVHFNLNAFSFEALRKKKKCILPIKVQAPSLSKFTNYQFTHNFNFILFIPPLIIHHSGAIIHTKTNLMFNFILKCQNFMHPVMQL